MSERIAIAITKRQFSTNYLWLIREGLERDMRQRGISEHDIDRTVLYLAGALQDNDLRVSRHSATELHQRTDPLLPLYC